MRSLVILALAFTLTEFPCSPSASFLQCAGRPGYCSNGHPAYAGEAGNIPGV